MIIRSFNTVLMWKKSYPFIPFSEGLEEAIHSCNHHQWGAIRCQQSLRQQSLPSNQGDIWEDLISYIRIHCVFIDLWKKVSCLFSIPVSQKERVTIDLYQYYPLWTFLKH